MVRYYSKILSSDLNFGASIGGAFILPPKRAIIERLRRTALQSSLTRKKRIFLLFRKPKQQSRFLISSWTAITHSGLFVKSVRDTQERSACQNGNLSPYHTISLCRQAARKPLRCWPQQCFHLSLIARGVLSLWSLRSFSS